MEQLVHPLVRRENGSRSRRHRAHPGAVGFLQQRQELDFNYLGSRTVSSIALFESTPADALTDLARPQELFIRADVLRPRR